MLDKYGIGNDPYPGTSILRNKLNLYSASDLSLAERDFSTIAANEIEFTPPPYNLPFLQQIHRQLFIDLYEWAGEVRTVDISKGATHFCTASRIKPEANKILTRLSEADYFLGLSRTELIRLTAEFFGDLNVVHPFREGNGRAVRVLFEHIIIHAGFDISWWEVEACDWIQANIDAVVCDYDGLERCFERCIGQPIQG